MKLQTNSRLRLFVVLGFGMTCWICGSTDIGLAVTVQNDSVVQDADRLWAAARRGDMDAVRQALDDGIEVNAATRYQSTALSFACDRGHIEVVRLLLDRGANPNVKDTFYQATPLTWAQSNEHYEVLSLLLSAGADGADDLLLDAIGGQNSKLVQAVIQSGKASPKVLGEARAQAVAGNQSALVDLFSNLDIPNSKPYDPATELLQMLAGTYTLKGGGAKLTVTVEGKILKVDQGFGQNQNFVPMAENEFAAGRAKLIFKLKEEQVDEVSYSIAGNSFQYIPSTEAEPEKPNESVESKENAASEVESPISSFEPFPADAVVSSPNWPGFRGVGSRGVADGQHPPVTWDIEKPETVAWKRDVPGYGNSCPVIWGERLFLTSAVSETGNKDVRIGLYGDVDSVEDDTAYDFVLLCLNKKTGETIWERTAHTGKPAVKRHSKSSHANPTVATDGRHVVAFFGSEGLYCYDFEGQLLWKKDLGLLDSGWFYDAGYQWGFGSSPIIFGDRVIVQCDIQKESFVAAFELGTGHEVWRTPREEIPTWSTPIVHEFGDVPMLITHGTRAARGYDVRDGQLLWTLPDHSEIVVPTPIVAHDLIFVASGYRPIQPIVAIKPTARGELKLPGRPASEGAESTESDPGIAWSVLRGGPYMPTPIAYGEFLYACSNNGVLTCYRATTGEQVYRQRLPASGVLSFTSSPLAADGHLYLTAEDGRVLVVQAGEKFKLESTNPSGGKALSTPAISEGMFYLRTVDQVMAFKVPE